MLEESPSQPEHEALGIGGAEPAQAILAVAKLAGVEHLWFVSGNDLVSFQEAAARAKEFGLPSPKIMQMVHEHVAISIAMGEAMIRRAPGAVAAHVDVGLLHMGGALHNAMVGQYPLLAITGYPGTTPERRTIPVFWKQQRWDQGSIARQYMKWDYKLATYDDPALVTARALQVASTPPQGPTYLILPKEVGHEPLGDDARLTTVDALGIPRLGAGPDDAVAEIALRLLEAESPLLITDRIGRDHRALRALDELAREFAIAVRATRHRMNLADDHPGVWAGGTYTSAQTPRNDGVVPIEEADVVLVVENLVPWIPVRERPSDDAWIAFAGADPAALTVPLYEYPSDLRIVADPADFLETLIEQMRSLRKSSHAERIRARWASFEEHAARLLAERDRADVSGGTIDDDVLGRAMAKVLEPEDALTWEMTDTTLIPRTRPDTLFESGGSSLGWSVAAGIGIRMADPGRFVASLVGDGAYQFGSPSVLLWAQTRYDAPLLVVIANNRGYRTGTVRLREDYPDGSAVRANDYSGGMFDPPPDFAAEAVAAGGFGARVDDPADLVATLGEARTAVERDGRPAVVDVWLPPLAPTRPTR
ncbi:MAG: thiamine pyrophosphate-dependent enzyme [Actinomycetota bacterium]